jgi:hypothetical protein
LLEGRIVRVLYAASAERLQTTIERVCELSRRLGDTSALLRGLLGVAAVYINRQEVVRSLEIARRCLELAERNQDREMLTAVQYLFAMGAYFSGDLLLASSQLSDLMKPLGSAQLRAAAELLPTTPWATLPGQLARVQLALGKPDEALRLSNEALSRGRQLKNALTLTLVIRLAAEVHAIRREPKATRELAEATIALAEEHGFQDALLAGRAMRGWAMTELGQTEEGVAELEAAAASSPAVRCAKCGIDNRPLGAPRPRSGKRTCCVAGLFPSRCFDSSARTLELYWIMRRLHFVVGVVMPYRTLRPRLINARSASRYSRKRGCRGILASTRNGRKSPH